MAQLSEQTTTTVLNIQRRLLAMKRQATATGFVIMEQLLDNVFLNLLE